MSEQPAVPEGLEIKQTRVYYDPDSGEVVHVHQLMSAPDEDLDKQRVEQEMNTFEESMRKQRAKLEYLIVDAGDLPAAGESLAVDVEHRRLQKQ